MAREATEVAETASYERGVLDTEKRLIEEVAGVCRDYCAEVWAEALNREGVPATFKLRSAENIFFPKDIREVPMTLPPPLKQLSTIQAPSPDAEVSTGASKSKEDVKGGPQLEEKGKDKEVQTPTKTNRSKDALMIKDVVSKAKDAESKSKVGDTKSKGS